MSRYSLWVKNKKDHNKSFIYQIHLNGKVLGEKADLYDIDAFTTEYLNENELLCSILNSTNVDDYKLEIRYRSNKVTKKLEVAYFDDVLIKNYSHIDRIDGKFIHGDDNDLLTILTFILNDKISGNGILVREFLDSKYINDYVKTYYTKYIYNRQSWNNNIRFFAKSKLLNELTRYKNIRGIMFFLKDLKQRRKEIFEKRQINMPIIEDRTNILPKEYERPIIIDDIDDEIDKNIETEYNFYDPYQRNYDEEIIDNDEPTPVSKSRSKVYTKKIPGQVSFLNQDDNA